MIFFTTANCDHQSILQYHHNLKLKSNKFARSKDENITIGGKDYIENDKSDIIEAVWRNFLLDYQLNKHFGLYSYVSH